MFKAIITTTTFYSDIAGKDKVRFDLACELVELARENGHILVVVDGSPVPDVAQKLKKAGAHVFPQSEKGMGASRRQVWIESNKLVTPDVAAIVWTEEKPDIIRSVKKMIDHMYKRNSQAVIPSRSMGSWNTYPVFQQESEQIANYVYNELFPNIDGLLDPMFGPVCFCPSEMTYFTDFKPAAWGLSDTYLQHYIPPFMRSKGRKVTSLEVDFVYPPQQRAEEENERNAEMVEKRLWQLKQLIAAYFTMRKRFCSQAIYQML